MLSNTGQYACFPKYQYCQGACSCSSSLENLNKTQCLSYGYCAPLGKYGMTEKECLDQVGASFTGQCKALLRETDCNVKTSFCQVYIPKEICSNSVFPTPKYPTLIWDAGLDACKADVDEATCATLTDNSGGDLKGSCTFSLTLNTDTIPVVDACGGAYVNDQDFLNYRYFFVYGCPILASNQTETELQDVGATTSLSYSSTSTECKINGALSPWDCGQVIGSPQNSLGMDTNELLFEYYAIMQTFRGAILQYDFLYRFPAQWISAGNQFDTKLTESQCNELKACTKDGKVLSGDVCDSKECVGRVCSSCQVADEYIFEQFCFNTTIDSCDCRLNGGKWIVLRETALDFTDYNSFNSLYTNGYCKFSSLNESQCVAQGHQFAACQGLSEDQCNSCSLGSFDSNCPIPEIINLRCQMKKSVCTENDCTPYCSGMEKFPGCVVSIDPFINTMGCYECPEGLVPSFLGCINFTRTGGSENAKQYCNITGGNWIERAVTEAECNSYLGCRTESSDVCNTYFPNNIGNGLLKSEESCLPPRGNVENIFRWAVPSFQTLQRVNVTWLSSPWVPENEWISVINQTSLVEKFEEGLTIGAAYSLQSYGICRYETFSTLFSQVLSSCVTPVVVSLDPNLKKKDEEQSYPNLIFSKRDFSLTSYDLGFFRFFYLQESLFSVGSAKIQSFKDSISSPLSSYEVIFKMYPISQFKVNFTLAAKDNSFQTLPVKNNSYAVISNSKGFKVGQFIADGVRVIISKAYAGNALYPDDKINYGLSSVNDTSNSTATVKFLLCVQIRRDIQVDPRFEVVTWATTTDYSNFVVASNLRTVMIEDKLCSNISSTSTLFPVAVLKNYDSAFYVAPILTDKETAYFSVLAGLFWIIGVAGGATSIFLIVGSSMVLQVLIIIFATVHAIIRAIYFTLLASERIILDQVDTKGEEAGILFLTFFHLILFFTCYTLLAHFWSWLAANSKDNQSLISKSRVLLIIKNVLIYLFFFTVVVLFGALNNLHQAQRSLRGYTITVAILSVLDLLFIIYFSYTVFLGPGKKIIFILFLFIIFIF